MSTPDKIKCMGPVKKRLFLTVRKNTVKILLELAVNKSYCIYYKVLYLSLSSLSLSSSFLSTLYSSGMKLYSDLWISD